MGSLQVSHLRWARPGGDTLFDDVSFRVGDGDHVALVGANGAGKTTLLRIIGGELAGADGTVAVDGHLAVMPQLVGSIRDSTTIQRAAGVVRSRRRAAGRRPADRRPRPTTSPSPTTPTPRVALRPGHQRLGRGRRLRDRGLLGHGHAPRCWASPYDDGAARDGWPPARAASRSGWRSRRCSGATPPSCSSTSPTTSSTSRASAGSRTSCGRSPKTILFVSHDRELLAGIATKIVTVEAKGTWTHGGGFATYHEARDARNDRLARDAAQWEDERARLVELVRVMQQRAKISDGFAPKPKAAETPPPALRGADQAARSWCRSSGSTSASAAGAPVARRSRSRGCRCTA